MLKGRVLTVCSLVGLFSYIASFWVCRESHFLPSQEVGIVWFRFAVPYVTGVADFIGGAPLHSPYTVYVGRLSWWGTWIVEEGADPIKMSAAGGWGQQDIF